MFALKRARAQGAKASAEASKALAMDAHARNVASEVRPIIQTKRSCDLSKLYISFRTLISTTVNTFELSVLFELLSLIF
jgi:hypothetical protein